MDDLLLRRRQCRLTELKPGEYMRRMVNTAMAVVYRCPSCERLVAVDVHAVGGTGRSIIAWSCPECKSPERHVQPQDYEPT